MVYHNQYGRGQLPGLFKDAPLEEVTSNVALARSQGVWVQKTRITFEEGGLCRTEFVYSVDMLTSAEAKQIARQFLEREYGADRIEFFRRDGDEMTMFYANWQSERIG